MMDIGMDVHCGLECEMNLELTACEPLFDDVLSENALIGSFGGGLTSFDLDPDVSSTMLGTDKHGDSCFPLDALSDGPMGGSPSHVEHSSNEDELVDVTSIYEDEPAVLKVEPMDYAGVGDCAGVGGSTLQLDDGIAATDLSSLLKQFEEGEELMKKARKERTKRPSKVKQSMTKQERLEYLQKEKHPRRKRAKSRSLPSSKNSSPVSSPPQSPAEAIICRISNAAKRSSARVLSKSNDKTQTSMQSVRLSEDFFLYSNPNNQKLKKAAQRHAERSTKLNNFSILKSEEKRLPKVMRIVRPSKANLCLPLREASAISSKTARKQSDSSEGKGTNGITNQKEKELSDLHGDVNVDIGDLKVVKVKSKSKSILVSVPSSQGRPNYANTGSFCAPFAQTSTVTSKNSSLLRPRCSVERDPRRFSSVEGVYVNQKQQSTQPKVTAPAISLLASHPNKVISLKKPFPAENQAQVNRVRGLSVSQQSAHPAVLSIPLGSRQDSSVYSTGACTQTGGRVRLATSKFDSLPSVSVKAVSRVSSNSALPSSTSKPVCSRGVSMSYVTLPKKLGSANKGVIMVNQASKDNKNLLKSATRDQSRRSCQYYLQKASPTSNQLVLVQASRSPGHPYVVVSSMQPARSAASISVVSKANVLASSAPQSRVSARAASQAELQKKISTLLNTLSGSHGKNSVAIKAAPLPLVQSNVGAQVVASNVEVETLQVAENQVNFGECPAPLMKGAPGTETLAGVKCERDSGEIVHQTTGILASSERSAKMNSPPGPPVGASTIKVQDRSEEGEGLSFIGKVSNSDDRSDVFKMQAQRARESSATLPAPLGLTIQFQGKIPMKSRKQENCHDLLSLPCKRQEADVLNELDEHSIQLNYDVPPSVSKSEREDEARCQGKSSLLPLSLHRNSEEMVSVDGNSLDKLPNYCTALSRPIGKAAHGKDDKLFQLPPGRDRDPSPERSQGRECDKMPGYYSCFSNSTRYDLSQQADLPTPSASHKLSIREQERNRYKQKQKQIKERRILYVGRIGPKLNKWDLLEQFAAFGAVEETSVHFREAGDNYGFVTFYESAVAYKAFEGANSVSRMKDYDICFGGRREFCGVDYADLDGDLAEEEEDGFGVKKRDESVLDFDELLQQARRELSS